MVQGLISPKVTRAVSLLTIIPIFFSAIIAKNIPIPAKMAYFMERGMVSINHFRALNKLSKINKTPDHKTQPNKWQQKQHHNPYQQ